MKQLIKIEEVFMFLLGIFLFIQLDYAWWWFAALLFVPDIGMFGYLFNSKIGAVTYNIFHHKGVAIALYLIGVYLKNEPLQLAGIIVFSHASLDRILGYGLKYDKGFKYTHLGEL